MSVGENELISPMSYLGFGRETTFGTGVTCTSGLDFLSFSLVTKQENKILEEIQRKRTHSKTIKMGKKIEGSCEFYFCPETPACNHILQNAFGGSITSATATGETVGGGAMEHQLDIGSMDGSYSSMSVNHRKGQVTSGRIFEYTGIKVSELVITAELDEAVKFAASLVAKDVTVTSNDIETALTVSSASPLTFDNGRLSIETSLASLTSSSFWHVQSIELTLGNSLKSDNDSRRIGSDVLDVLPVGIAVTKLKIGLRFDTTTAYDAMLAGTALSGEFEFLGPTISGSLIQEKLKFVMPSLKINESSEPEIGGPDEILKSSADIDVLRDASSAGGYALRAYVVNSTADYS